MKVSIRGQELDPARQAALVAASRHLANLIGQRKVGPSEWTNHRPEVATVAITVNGVEVSFEQECAVLAGLRHLARDLMEGEVAPNDGGVGDILTNAGEFEGLDAEAIQRLGDLIVGG